MSIRLIDVVNALPDKPWNMQQLSYNPNITMADVEANPQYQWDASNMCFGLTIDDILTSPITHTFCYLGNSFHITLKHILDNPTIPWNYETISYNPNITMADVLDHPTLPWNYNRLSANPAITLDDILQHPELEWDLSGLSGNPNITFQYVLTHHPGDGNYFTLLNPSIAGAARRGDNAGIYTYSFRLATNWDWITLNRRLKLEITDVLNNPTLPWYYDCLSENSSFTLQDMTDHPAIKWNLKYASNNPSITLRDMLTYPISTWNWLDVSYNANIGIQDVIDHPELPWNYEMLALRFVTLQDILDAPDAPCGLPQLANYEVLSRSWFDYIILDPIAQKRQGARTGVFKQELFARTVGVDEDAADS
jgi:hypothetical protein